MKYLILLSLFFVSCALSKEGLFRKLLKSSIPPSTQVLNTMDVEGFGNEIHIRFSVVQEELELLLRLKGYVEVTSLPKESYKPYWWIFDINDKIYEENTTSKKLPRRFIITKPLKKEALFIFYNHDP